MEFRAIVPDEFTDFLRADALSFNEHVDPKDFDLVRNVFEFDRSIAAFENGTIVGTSGSYAFELTLPGLQTVPCGGVSWVGVRPTHRRRGILRGMMRPLLDGMRERGEPIAILMASESPIYGRFGFGMATQAAEYEIERGHTDLKDAPSTPGTVDFVDVETARVLLPEIYDRMRRRQPGFIGRKSASWEMRFADPESWRNGLSAIFYLMYRDASGTPAGYASYRTKDTWENGIPRGEVHVRDLAYDSIEAYVALWELLTGLDLTAKITLRGRPTDEPIRWLLTDQRRLRTTSIGDFLWLRLLDIAGSLAARRYATEGRITFEIEDAFYPDNNGRYTLDASPDGAECRRSSDEPDIVLSASDLGACYLGNARFATLAAVGRIRECRSGALLRADSLFLSDPPAWCNTGF